MGTFLIILLVVLLLFSHRLADLGRGLGEGVRNLKRGLKPEPEPPQAKLPRVEPSPMKLLPAKGETTRGSDAPAGPDGETRKV